MKLKLQEAELEESRQKRSDREDDFNFKYSNSFVGIASLSKVINVSD